MNTERKLILYIAVSLDGYIAGPGDDLSFLSMVEQEGEDYGYMDFMSTVDTVIMGRRTYNWVMTKVSVFPYTDLETYIITHSLQPAEGSRNYYNGSPGMLVRELKTKPGKNIFVVGGAEIVHQLLLDKLIDEFYIAVIPVFLGDGIKLFKNERPEQKLKLNGIRSYPAGLAMLNYILP